MKLISGEMVELKLNLESWLEFKIFWEENILILMKNVWN